jgi:hypothetical protein
MKYLIIEQKYKSGNLWYACRDNFISRVFNYSYAIVGISGTVSSTSEDECRTNLKCILRNKKSIRKIVGVVIQ